MNLIECRLCTLSFKDNAIWLDPIRNEYFCSKCFFRMNPPVFVLVRPWYSDTYIYPVTGTTVFREVDDFQNCGFHLFNRKIFNHVGINPRAREVLTFHYRGKLKCNMLINYYKHWPALMPRCQKINCF